MKAQGYCSFFKDFCFSFWLIAYTGSTIYNKHMFPGFIKNQCSTQTKGLNNTPESEVGKCSDEQQTDIN